MWCLLAFFCYIALVSLIFFLYSAGGAWSEFFGLLFFGGLFLLVWRVNSKTLENGLIFSAIVYEPWKDLRRNSFDLGRAWREKEGGVFPFRLSLFWAGLSATLLAGVAVMAWQILFQWNAYADWKRVSFSVLFVFFLTLALFGKIEKKESGK